MMKTTDIRVTRTVTTAKTELEGTAVRLEPVSSSRIEVVGNLTYVMKLKNKGNSNATVTGPFVAIGSRGVTCPPLEKMFDAEEGIELNAWNDLPAKERQGSDMPAMPLWRRSHSWVQSRKTPDGSDPKFFFGTLDYAIKHKMVQVLENITVERKKETKDLPRNVIESFGNLPKTAVGTLILPKDWKPGQKQPKMCGFIANKGQKWPGGRIEAAAVNEPKPRNIAFVGSIHWPESVTKTAEKAAKAQKNVAENKPATKIAGDKKEQAKKTAPATRKEVAQKVAKSAEAVTA
jgi:hypothetical protein